MTVRRQVLISDDAELRRVTFSTPWGFLAMGFGSGLLRGAPGTAGTVAAMPFALVLAALPPAIAGVVVLALFAAGIWLCHAAATALGRADPGAIVWDEMVAFCLAAILVPAGWPWFAAAFFAFRFFDIAKPWPIRWLERRLAGGLGIMADDVVAAVYTVVLLRLADFLAGLDVLERL